MNPQYNTNMCGYDYHAIIYYICCVFTIQAVLLQSSVEVFDSDYEARYDGSSLKHIDVLDEGQGMYVLTEKKVRRIDKVDNKHLH